MIAYLMIGIANNTFSLSSSDFGVGEAEGSGTTGYPFWAIFFQPYTWNSLDLIEMFGGIFAIGATIAIASYFSRSDISTLYWVFVALVSFGAVPIFSIYKFVYNRFGAHACPNVDLITNICPEAAVMAALIAGPIAIYYVFTCVGWWAWRETT